jgi:hypothetical protein
MGAFAVRIDALERLAAAAATRAEQGPFAATEALAATVGVATDALAPLLQALGYRRHGSGAEATFERRHWRRAAMPVSAMQEPASPLSETGSVASARPRRRRRRRRDKAASVAPSAMPTEPAMAAAKPSAANSVQRPVARAPRKPVQPAPDSPFAVLAGIKWGRRS